MVLVDTGNSYQGLCEMIRCKTNGADGVYFKMCIRDRWNTDLDKYITKNNIKDVIPDASFYDLTTKISNVLTDHIRCV